MLLSTHHKHGATPIRQQLRVRWATAVIEHEHAALRNEEGERVIWRERKLGCEKREARAKPGRTDDRLTKSMNLEKRE